LGSIYKDYTLRKWELNLYFVDNLTDAYDNFTERLLTSDRDFIEIGREMDWQDLVNKAAEVELKARVRGTRTSAFKATTSLCCSSPNCSTVHANVADSADTNSALEAAKKALNEARKNTPANIGFVEDIEEIDVMMAADPQRLPTVNLEERQIKKYLADARRRKGHHHYLDSGAGRHVSGHIEAFEHLEDLEEPVRVNGFEGSAMVRQQGTLRLQINVNGYHQTMRVSNVLYHAPLPFTLLSVKAFGVRGYQSTFDATEAWITRNLPNNNQRSISTPATAASGTSQKVISAEFLRLPKVSTSRARSTSVKNVPSPNRPAGTPSTARAATLYD
ncbi:MAG: hypothetical protein L6R36_009509, partial [Xanthoria steineri]